MCDLNICSAKMLYITIHLIILGLVYADYWEERANLIRTSQNKSIGATLVLSPSEENVNQILMNLKYQDFDEGFQNPKNFLGAQHFFKARDEISNSRIYKIIQQLPKGASLHSHDTALVSTEYLFSLTYEEDLYVLFGENDTLQFKFFNSTSVPSTNPWINVANLRKVDTSFDTKLRRKLTMIVENPEIVYSDVNVAWKAFGSIFRTVIPIICYKPNFEKYFYQALKELYEDNVMYLEFRTTLPQVYDIYGSKTVYTAIDVAEIYQNISNKFKQDYPKFQGVKLIYAPSRRVENTTVEQYVATFRKLKDAFGKFIAGFDLVGQEDLGHPLVDFIPYLLEIKNETKFFFHAGETNWYGQQTDFNLFDAVLLNTSRIGHGYAIFKHPEIQRIVKEQNIAIEISPISNQVLDLVQDLRNHPGNFLISDGYPVVITCDDPSFWGAKALSYDWYEAFMAMSSRESDLKLLKQLAINSIKYSSIEEKEKQLFLEQWTEDWNKFIFNVFTEFNTVPHVIDSSKLQRVV